MKKMLIPVMALAMACNSSQKTVAPTTETPQEVTPVTYANTITEGELKEMLYTFASDDLKVVIQVKKVRKRQLHTYVIIISNWEYLQRKVMEITIRRYLW